jgi:hypothetical protein
VTTSNVAVKLNSSGSNGVTTDNSDTDTNNNSSSDDLIDIGNGGAATSSAGTNGDGTVSEPSSSGFQMMDPAPPVPSGGGITFSSTSGNPTNSGADVGVTVTDGTQSSNTSSVPAEVAGAFEVYDISHNAITSAAAMGTVGLEWTVAGFGDFSTTANESDMLMRNSNTGAFELYDIRNNAITFSSGFGQVGLEWTVAGFGDFSGNPNETDMLMRSNTAPLSDRSTIRPQPNQARIREPTDLQAEILTIVTHEFT